MISDYFPKETRARAVAFYTMGIAMGVGLAMLVGGQVVAFIFDAPPVVVPVFGELYAWQTVFLVVGLPGLLMAVLMWTVREPIRRERMRLASETAAVDQIPLADAVRFFVSRWRMYGTHFLGMSVVGIMSYGFYAWIPTMFIRTWGWSIRDIGTAYGIVTLATAPVAVVIASWLTETFMKKGYQDAHMRAALWGALLGIAGSILTPLAPTPALSVVMLIPASAGLMCTTAAGISALMIVTPNQMRAQASALYYFVINLLGLTIGPTGIALFTDYVFKDDAMLRYSVACVAVLAGLFATGFLVYNMRHYKKMYIESLAWSGDEPG